ncbi:MAG: ATP-binding protein, partial [Gammaproteobacteria bacterium]|nr:ATP-binding protein [Gammaproteobacteria bacterium]
LFIPFDNLSTTMFDTESSGIGLTVVQNLMELMHGQVGVTSTPEGNTTFWLELPLNKSSTN